MSWFNNKGNKQKSGKITKQQQQQSNVPEALSSENINNLNKKYLITLLQMKEAPKVQPDLVMYLQETIGNQAVCQLLKEAGLISDKPKSAYVNASAEKIKSNIENISGVSLSDVKVRYNSNQPSKLGAFAFTKGTEIHVAPGQKIHLPHEMWHAVQQKQGRVKPTGSLKGNKVNKSAGLEKEADVMGMKALSSVAKSMPSRNTSKGVAAGQVVQKKENDKPTTFSGKQLIAHKLVHTVKQGAVNNNRIIQASGLGKIPEEERKGIRTITSDIQLPEYIMLTKLFEPGYNGLVFNNKDVPKFIKDNITFSGTEKVLENGLRQISGLFVDNNNNIIRLPINTSVTWMAKFADENFKACTYYEKLSDDVKNIYKSDAVFRFTHLKEGANEKMLIESLGVIEKSENQPTAEESENQKETFEKYFSIASASEAGEGYKDYTVSEKAMLYKTAIRLPEDILNTIIGVKWKRKDKDPEEKDTAGYYVSKDHSITLFDTAFKDHNVLYGNMKDGFHTVTEKDIIHEMGHALDYTPIRNINKNGEKPENVKCESGTTLKKNIEGKWEKVLGGYKTKFCEAAENDGVIKGVGDKLQKTITEYAEKNWKECYADSFSLYFNDPERMERTYPTVFKYFNDQYGKK